MHLISQATISNQMFFSSTQILLMLWEMAPKGCLKVRLVRRAIIWGSRLLSPWKKARTTQGGIKGQSQGSRPLSPWEPGIVGTCHFYDTVFLSIVVVIKQFWSSFAPRFESSLFVWCEISVIQRRDSRRDIYLICSCFLRGVVTKNF